MVSTCPLIFKVSSPCTNPLVTVPRAPITIDVTVSFMFHSFFFQFPCKVRVFFFLFAFFQFYSVVSRDNKVHNSTSSIFLLIIVRSGRLVKIRRSVCISKSQKSLCVSFSRTDSGLSIYHLIVSSNLNFLHSFQWISFPAQLCLFLFSFCASFLHLLISLIVSSLSSHNLHMLFCCVLSILTLIWLVLMALFWYAIRRDSLSLSFPFLSHVHIFSYRRLLLVA